MNKNELIRNFTFGFIPIMLFLIADTWFGVIYGLVVAIGFGLVELLYFYIREKSIEKFILFDIGLLVLLGGISILLKNDLLFKLKPALMEMILVVILGIHGFTRHPVLFMMARRYFGDMEPAPHQKKLMRTIVRIMAVVLLGHVFLITWSAYYWSREWWAFISGGLFYVIVILMAVGQWVYVRKKKQVPQPGKSVDLCDAKGKIIKRVADDASWRDSVLYRPAVFLQIFDKKGRLYLVPNSVGAWDISFQIDLFSGEELPKALTRNGFEPDGQTLKPLARYPLDSNNGNRLVHLYQLQLAGAKSAEIAGLKDGRFWSVFEISKNLQSGFFSAHFEQAFGIMRRAHLF